LSAGVAAAAAARREGKMSFIMTIDDELAAILEQIEADRPTALPKLKRLAEAGHQSAILCLGSELSCDPLTNGEAIPWLLRAVAFGSAIAAWNLAMIAGNGAIPRPCASGSTSPRRWASRTLSRCRSWAMT
jgi:hypothetical protein